MYKNKNGFTLVELSIVLIIIGLLVGGILSGRSLLKAAELRSAASELQKWQSGVTLFVKEYGQLPGDMSEATRYWPARHTNTVECQGLQDNTRTCNGNGDGILQEDVWTWSEEFLFWQHLALAGLIDGSYSGFLNSPVVIGRDVPRSQAGKGSGWSVVDMINLTASQYWANPSQFYRKALVLGAPDTVRATTSPVFTAEEAWNIDSKLDDGKPASGTVRSMFWSQCTTATNKNGFDALYNMQSPSARCALLFPLAIGS